MPYRSRFADPRIDRLFEAILGLRSQEECYRFFEDLCTVQEIQTLAQRLQVAEMLVAGATYEDISQHTGMSSATISRIKRFLLYGADGYRLILRRLEESAGREGGPRGAGDAGAVAGREGRRVVGRRRPGGSADVAEGAIGASSMGPGAAGGAAPAEAAGQADAPPRPWVIGHRGCAGLRPENTLAAFRHALELGVDAVECDVHRTRDGLLAVVHDARLERTTNGRGDVAEHTMAELQALDAGGAEPVPSLEQVLDLVRGRAHVVIELKSAGSAGPAVEAVRARAMFGQATFISFHPAHLAEVRALAPQARTGALFTSVGPEALETAARAGASVLDVQFRAGTPALARAARARGMLLWVWTPNDEAELRLALSARPDGITTDRPDVLQRLLAASDLP